LANNINQPLCTGLKVLNITIQESCSHYPYLMEYGGVPNIPEPSLQLYSLLTSRHNLLPKNVSPIGLFRSGYSICSILDVRPFIRFTKSLIDNFGGYSICIWTWSLLTTPFKIWTSSASHIWMINSLHLCLISPFKYRITILCHPY